MKYFFFLLFLILCIVNGISNEADMESAYSQDLLKNTYKINELITNVEYLTDENDRPYIKIDQTYLFEKMLNSGQFRLVCFYDDFKKKFIGFSNEKGKGMRIQPEITSGTYSMDGIFHSDMKFKTFGYSLNKIGNRGKIKVSYRINDLRYFSHHYFHSLYPVDKSTATFKIPNEFSIKLIPYNLDQWKSSIDSIIVDSYRKYIFTIDSLECKTFHKENYNVLDMEYYPGLIVVPQRTKIGGKEDLFFESTNEYYQWANGFVKMLDPDKQMIDSLYNEIIPSFTSNDRKIKLIYNWVQDNIRYIAFEHGINGFKPDEAHLVLEKGYGDCKGKANLCRELLKRAGFDARFVWVNTEYFQFSYDQTPVLIKDNHMICAIKKEDGFVFLDPTHPYTSDNEIPSYLFGKEVLIENGENYKIDTVFKRSEQKEGVERTIVFDSISGNKMYGFCTLKFHGGAKHKLFSLLKNAGKADYEDVFRNVLEANNKVEVLGYIYSKVFAKDRPFVVTAKLIYKNAIQQFGSKRKFISQFPYDDIRYLKRLSHANVPVELEMPLQIIDSISYKIEDGFDLKPYENIEIKNDILQYSNSAILENNRLLVKRTVKFNTIYVNRDLLPEFKQSVNKIIKSSNKYLTIIK